MAGQWSIAAEMASMGELEKGGLIDKQVLPMVVREAEYTVAKTGSKGWKFIAEIMEGQYAGERLDGAAWFSRKSKRALQFFFDQMHALGITNEILESGESPDQIAGRMVGTIFNAEISVETDNKNGKKSNRMVAASYIGVEGEESGGSDVAGGDDELDFSEFETPALTAEPEASTDLSADDPEIAAANAGPAPDGTAGDTPTALPADDLEDIWNPTTV